MPIYLMYNCILRITHPGNVLVIRQILTYTEIGDLVLSPVIRTNLINNHIRIKATYYSRLRDCLLYIWRYYMLRVTYPISIVLAYRYAITSRTLSWKSTNTRVIVTFINVYQCIT